MLVSTPPQILSTNTSNTGRSPTSDPTPGWPSGPAAVPDVSSESQTPALNRQGVGGLFTRELLGVLGTVDAGVAPDSKELKTRLEDRFRNLRRQSPEMQWPVFYDWHAPDGNKDENVVLIPWVRPQDDPATYLRAVAANLARSPFPWPLPHDGMDFFRDLHVQVRVGPRRRNSLEDRDRERRRLTGMATFDDRFEGRQTGAYRPAADKTRFPRGSSDPPLPWFDETTARTARDVHPWAVLLGDPGMGKTTLLRYEGWLVANEALSALEDGSARPEDFVMPIYARLADLADQADHDVPGLLARAGVDAGRGSGTPASVLRGWVLEKLKDGRVIVLLDALDELSDQDHDRVMRRLVRWVGDHRPQGLYITSRPAGYRRIPPELRDGVKPELELVAFTPAEVRRYVRGILGAKSPESAALWAQLQVSPGLLGLAEIPLMLTLICLVFAEEDPGRSPVLPGTRGELLAHCLDGLLGRWQYIRERGYDPEMSPEEEVELRGKRDLLAEIAWELSGQDPENTLFTAVDFDRAFERAALRVRLPVIGDSPARAGYADSRLRHPGEGGRGTDFSLSLPPSHLPGIPARLVPRAAR